METLRKRRSRVEANTRSGRRGESMSKQRRRGREYEWSTTRHSLTLQVLLPLGFSVLEGMGPCCSLRPRALPFQTCYAQHVLPPLDGFNGSAYVGGAETHQPSLV